MPTWGPTDAGAGAVGTSSGLGAGAGPHLPVGTWSGTRYRSICRWAVPGSWGTWVGITSATLKVKTTDFAHVGVRNSSIYVKRESTASGGQWTKGSGTQNCNSGFSGSNATQYADMNPVPTNFQQFQSGTGENSWKTIDVTAMVRDYFNARATVSVLTFILDQQDNTDYSEFWSDDSAGNEPTLTIVYSDAAPPDAPTLGYPASGAVIKEQNPLFTWTHSATGGDPQVEAEITVWDAAGTTIVAGPTVIPDDTASYQYPSNLARHLSYQWSVRTKDVSGYGPQAAKRTFKVQGAPTVTFPSPRAMAWGGSPGAPRINLTWETLSDNPTQDDAQSDYQIESPVGTVLVPYTGTGNNGSKTKLLTTLAIADNTSYTIRVRAKTVGIPDEGFADTVIKPRFGLTTHHKVVVPTPTQWIGTAIQPPTQPAGTDLHMQYGSSATSSAAPDAWFDDLSSVTPNPHLFWRAYLIPSATAGPTMDKVVISSSGGAALDLDKWTRDVTFPTTPQPQKPHAFSAPWFVDQGEYVYGSRSVRIDVTGAGPFYLWHEKSIRLRAGRSYILTGLMKSKGNSGACFEVQDSSGVVLQAQGVGLPPGPMRSEVLVADSLFYASNKDVNRHRTPVLTVGGADIDVYVALKAGGVAGSQAWFDAIKLEESTVATPWSPGAIGATIIDAGGVQIDASKGGTFRLRGSDGATRSVVGSGAKALSFAGDTELESPATGVLAVNGVPIRAGAFTAPIRRVYTANATWTRPAGLSYIEVEVQGGGGGGGSAQTTPAGQQASAGGGGGGAYAKKLFTAADLAALTGGQAAVVVGANGAGGTNGGNGAAGALSSFAGTGIATVTGNGAAGGLGGPTTASGNVNTGGSGGAATGGDINVKGEGGSTGSVASGVRAAQGGGGSSALGGGGLGGGNGGDGGIGAGGGGGSSPASTASRPGGDGGPGMVIVTEYYL